MIEPLVSVKMITYNHAPYIAQAIEGVLSQKVNFPIELVIGEDCSTDGTREIVLKYRDRYPDIIRVITSDRNVGMKKNGYRTTKACRGKYVAFCEGDDFWHHPEKLQKQAEYLDTHPECGLIYSSYDVLEMKSGKLIKDYPNHRKFNIPVSPSLPEIIDRVRISFRIQTCTAMVVRSYLEELVDGDPYLYQSDQFLMGDTQLWAELAEISKIAYIAESLATYRVLEDSATCRKDPKKALLFEKSHCEMLLYLCEKYRIEEAIRKRKEMAWCDVTLRLAFYERNNEMALEVRRKESQFTIKEWLRYFGARNIVINYFCRFAAGIGKYFRKDAIN